MSNFDRAVKALNDVDEAIDHLADNEAYVTALEASGLLMPDLPKPEDEWESEYPGVMYVRFGRAVSTCTPSRKPAVYLHGMVHETQIARQIALDILAACEYAEKEQDNE